MKTKWTKSLDSQNAHLLAGILVLDLVLEPSGIVNVPVYYIVGVAL